MLLKNTWRITANISQIESNVSDKGSDLNSPPHTQSWFISYSEKKTGGSHLIHTTGVFRKIETLS